VSVLVNPGYEEKDVALMRGLTRKGSLCDVE